ncbi:MAG: DNA-directed RNA polymerase subunit beta [Firmicutes bacterium]|nr:DNA-directed RNA polymerase subunit beta [Bacillota bacterium]
MPKAVMLGKKERQTFSKINEVADMPNLIQIQTKSYENFIKEGLREVFDDISPIQDYAGNLVLEFIDYSLSDPPKYDQETCKERDATYAAPLKVKVRLITNDTGEVKEQEVFMGDFPLMTEKGTFIYNGAERVVVTQLVRSPGPYYEVEIDKSGKGLYKATVIPSRGAWLEYETDSNEILSVRVDRTRKQPLTIFIRAMDMYIAAEQERFGCNEGLSLSTDQDILDVFGEDSRLIKTLAKDQTNSNVEGLKGIYRMLRPGEPPTEESAFTLIRSLLFDPKRYDISGVGRFKYNKKLGLSNRLEKVVIAQDVADPATGEILAQEGERIDLEKAIEIENAGVKSVWAYTDEEHEEKTKIIGNNFVALDQYIKFDVSDLKLMDKVYYPVLMQILRDNADEEDIKKALKTRKNDLCPKHIIIDDMIASVSYMLNLNYGIGNTDDIDHLGNRRLRTVGELLQNQFRIGLSRMERVVRERMTTNDVEATTPQQLMNIRPVTAAIKEFFGSSQLSQFMDQTNPLAELTHKRRLSALGPGGLSRERAGFQVRDVHHSHYGRMCPIETPEGPNIGLIGSLTTYGIINKYGFIETPYRVVRDGVVTEEIQYLSADEEERKIIAQANEPLDSEGHFVNARVASRGEGGEIDLIPRERIDYMDVSPKQVVSVATAMIPFLENDDANRALMGSNMQRQAVPLLVAEAPIVGTGIEHKAAKDSGVVQLAKHAGVIDYVDANQIRIRRDDGEGVEKYDLLKFKRSNQGTCINQRPIVFHGEHVEEGEVIADGPSTENGEVALGKNLLIGFMTWEGYNYEDAIILNERLVMDDVLTSLHIVEYEQEARDTKLGPEEITRDIPNLGGDVLKDLDEDGIIRVGAEVTSQDVLVGKVTPKGETELSAEERMLRAIFGEKAKEVRDTSLRMPHGETGIVVDVKVFDREDGEMNPGINKVVRVYVATKRKINVGDKMAGRHGNKGVISRILPEEDMPFLEDGQPLQVMLNPLGVPSRMNVGQVLEVHLGLAAKKKGWYVATPVFDGANEKDITALLEECGYDASGKLRLRDGRTGEYFDNPVTVGYMYMLKLHHLVDDKIHARSTGPYSLVTQQPLGGKAQFGGQRFGEMEVWALEAYGAAYTLQEILTVKSDDIVGRVKTYEAIVKGGNIKEPDIPESFKVLIKEMQALGLDIKVLSEDSQEIRIRESSEFDGAMDFRAVLNRDAADSERAFEEREMEEQDEYEDDDDEIIGEYEEEVEEDDE